MNDAALAGTQFRFLGRGEVKLSSFTELSPVPQDVTEAKRGIYGPEDAVSLAGELESEVRAKFRGPG